MPTTVPFPTAYSTVNLPAIPLNPNPQFVIHQEWGTEIVYTDSTGEHTIDVEDGDVIEFSGDVTIISRTRKVISEWTIDRRQSRSEGPGALSTGRIGLVAREKNVLLSWVDSSNSVIKMCFVQIDPATNPHMTFGQVFDVSGETSPFGVELALSGSQPNAANEMKVHIAWAGTDTAHTVNYAEDLVFDYNLPFVPPAILPEQKKTLWGQTSNAPIALATRPAPFDEAYLAWTGTDAALGTPNLWGPADNPGHAVLWGETSPSAPRLYYYGGSRRGDPNYPTNWGDRLLLTWQGSDENNWINILDIYLPDMTATKYEIAQSTACAPALLTSMPTDSQLWYMAWIDRETGQLATAACEGYTPDNWSQMTLWDPTPLPSAGVTLAPNFASGQELLVGYVWGGSLEPRAVEIARITQDPSNW